MRRLSSNRNVWLNRRIEQLQKKKSNRKRLLRHSRRNGNLGLLRDHSRPELRQLKPNQVCILPKHADLEENIENTVHLFRQIRNAALGRTKLKYLDFNPLRVISPAAALMLAAEIDRWNQHIGKKLRAHTRGWDPSVTALLDQMGLFELLKLEGPEKSLSPRNTVFLRFKSGSVASDQNRAERSNGELARDLRSEIEQLAGPVSHTTLFQGLSEAMANVSQHAYRTNESESPRLFWFSGSFNRRTRKLIVMFYDQGVGIPATVPFSGLFEGFKEKMKRWNDAEKIEAAMMLGRTSTQREERGKGLRDFLEFIDRYPIGKLSIYSGYGVCVFEKEPDTTNFRNAEKGRRSLIKEQIQGTLIVWEVYLSESE